MLLKSLICRSTEPQVSRTACSPSPHPGVALNWGMMGAGGWLPAPRLWSGHLWSSCMLQICPDAGTLLPLPSAGNCVNLLSARPASPLPYPFPVLPWSSSSVIFQILISGKPDFRHHLRRFQKLLAPWNVCWPRNRCSDTFPALGGVHKPHKKDLKHGPQLRFKYLRNIWETRAPQGLRWEGERVEPLRGDGSECVRAPHNGEFPQ